MATEITKAGAKPLISKDWTPNDGIKALPKSIRQRVIEAVSRFRMGDDPEDNFFKKRLDTETKMAIASELVIEHIAYGDIAKLLGVTRRGLQYMLTRLRERNANMLPLTWNRDRLVETVDALEDAGYMSLGLAEADPDPRNKAAFLSIATKAYSDAGNLRVKLGVSKDLIDALRNAARGIDGEPDPNERIDYIDWVYRNRIAPRLEGPKDDAEIVPEPVRADSTGGDEDAERASATE